MAQTNGVIDNIGNIVNYVEQQTGLDIMKFDTIEITNTKYTRFEAKEEPLVMDSFTKVSFYKFIKDKDGFKEVIKGKIIKNKSQINNRLQYLRQSGYDFENLTYSGHHKNGIDYVCDGKELEIQLI
jgi:hypothetical protein